MHILPSDPPTAREPLVRLLLFLLWAALVLFLASRHVVWRDEVRAFSIALSGDDVPAMLRNLHGEGHPALWYLLLRGAHTIEPVREVLPATAFLIAAAAMALLCARAPFRPLVIGLVLFGAFGLFEYSVSARNYGISMLLLFALAELYPRWRDRGIVIGLALALLCNTNVPSALLAAAFLLFWLVEVVSEEGLRWTRKHSLFALNAAVAAPGAFLCFLEVFPTVHDAVVGERSAISLGNIATALAAPPYSFWSLVPPLVPATPVTGALFGLVVFGSLCGLVRVPAAFLSAAAALAAFELFFQLVFGGSYRHQALFLVYLIAMYWLAARGRGNCWPGRWPQTRSAASLAAAGQGLFLLLLALQVPSATAIAGSALHDVPYSRARDLGDLLRREKLLDATVIADPDIFLESLPYYTPNRLYLLREQRFGQVVRFTRKARLELTLADVLADARALRARSGRPVVIVLHQRLDAPAPFRVHEVYAWTFSATADQVRDFLAATHRLARFGPAVTDESYDVYLLR